MEWHKKTYTSKITNFFQKQNCEAQSSILICSLWFLSPKVDSPMALPHIWHLVRKHNIFILIFFPTNPWYKYTFQHDSIRYYVCLSVFNCWKSLEAVIHKCSVNKLFRKFSGNSSEKLLESYSSKLVKDSNSTKIVLHHKCFTVNFLIIFITAFL